VVACRTGDVILLARMPGRVALADGTPVCLVTDAPIHLFDAQSGQRIANATAPQEPTGA
jgi:hypothetical protein